MHCVLVAKLTMLFKLHPIRMCFFLFFGFIVALFALQTRKCDFCSQFFHPVYIYYILKKAINIGTLHTITRIMPLSSFI